MDPEHRRLAGTKTSYTVTVKAGRQLSAVSSATACGRTAGQAAGGVVGYHFILWRRERTLLVTAAPPRHELSAKSSW